jgi:protein SCO1/2
MRQSLDRRGAVVLFFARITLGLAIGAALIAHEPAARAAPTTVGGPFELTATDGATVTDQTYRGKWLLVYFGYTSCPDSCPTTLIEIGNALAALGADAADIQPLFITVDPPRDTPEAMQKYMESFDPRIVGLTGSPQQIAAVIREYGAYAAPHKTGENAENYLVDHSSYLYLINPEGAFVRGFAADMPGVHIGGAVRLLVDQYRDQRDLNGKAAK